MFVALTVSSLLQYGIRANAHEGLENKEEPQEPKSEEPAKVADEKMPEEKPDEKMPDEKTPKKEETEEFVEVQKQILAGVEKMEPLLQKAEAFMDKYQQKK